MLLSIRTAHFNFALNRLNNKSSPQFIRLNSTKCRLSKVIVHLRILEWQGKPFFCRSATRTFLHICRLIIYRNVAMILKPSLSWLASAGTGGMSVTQLTRMTISQGTDPRLEDSTGHQSHVRFGGKTRHKLPNAKWPSKYVFFLVKLLYCCRRIAQVIYLLLVLGYFFSESWVILLHFTFEFSGGALPFPCPKICSDAPC